MGPVRAVDAQVAWKRLLRSRIAAAAQGELAGADARTMHIAPGRANGTSAMADSSPARTLARLIVDIKATTDCQCVVVGGSVIGRRVSGRWWKRSLAQEPAAFHVDLLAAHYRHDGIYLGLRCWPRRKIMMMRKYQAHRSLGYIPRYRMR
ncbi:ROK family protein [Escherichia coli]|nr:ROK family protein [Escherichia coli]